MNILPNRSQNNVPSIFKKQLDASKKITGVANTFTVFNPYQLMPVVPLPSIALQWLINSNGWPLNRMTSCTGEPKTFKSAFSYQLASWFLEHGGIAQIMDTTRKLPSKSLHDMSSNNALYEEYAKAARLQISRIKSQEEWIDILEKADELRKPQTNCLRNFSW